MVTPLVRLLHVAQRPPQLGNAFLVSARWPAALPRRALRRSHWLPRLAATDGLRAWLARDVTRWPLFCDSYWADLAANPARWAVLLAAASGGELLLLHDDGDVSCSPALALAQFLQGRLAAAALANEAGRLASPPCWLAQFEGDGNL